MEGGAAKKSLRQNVGEMLGPMWEQDAPES